VRERSSRECNKVAAPVTVHVLVWVTEEVSLLYYYWRRRMDLMAKSDPNAIYQFHVGGTVALPTNASVGAGPRAAGNYMDRTWRRSVREKMAYANSTIHGLQGGSLALFTDLDVAPLASYSHLLRWLDDVVMMHEPQPSATPRDLYNVGLFMVRTNDRSLSLLDAWAREFEVGHQRRNSWQGVQPYFAKVLPAARAVGLRFQEWPSDVVCGRSFPWQDPRSERQMLQVLRDNVAAARAKDPSVSITVDHHPPVKGTAVAYHAVALGFDTSLRGVLSPQQKKLVTMMRAINYTQAGRRGVSLRKQLQQDEEVRSLLRECVPKSHL